jgi:hypothetical protein
MINFLHGHPLKIKYGDRRPIQVTHSFISKTGVCLGLQQIIDTRNTCLIWFPKFPFSLTLRLIINTELKNKYETNNMNYIDDIYYRMHFICIMNAISSLTLHK